MPFASCISVRTLLRRTLELCDDMARVSIYTTRRCGREEPVAVNVWVSHDELHVRSVPLHAKAIHASSGNAPSDSRCRWAETRIPSTVVRGEQMLRTVTPFGIEQPTRNRLLLTRQLTQLTLFPDTAGGNRFSPLGATILSVLHWCLFWCLPARCSFYSHQCNKTTRRKHAHNRLLAATPLVQQTLAQPNKICTRHVEDGVADIVVYVPIAFLRARTQPAAS